MPKYLRLKNAGEVFFFTVVTFQRQKLFDDEPCRRLLAQTIKEVKNSHPFTIEAWVLLPDHLHCIWTLPPGDEDFSTRWRLIKGKFSRRASLWRRQEHLLNPSRRRRRETTIWQRRFWEHAIRDEKDFQNHFDYIHYNPMKHGLVRRVRAWPYSTFHRYVRQGIYPEDWGGEILFAGDDLFGE